MAVGKVRLSLPLQQQDQKQQQSDTQQRGRGGPEHEELGRAPAAGRARACSFGEQGRASASCAPRSLVSPALSSHELAVHP